MDVIKYLIFVITIISQCHYNTLPSAINKNLPPQILKFLKMTDEDVFGVSAVFSEYGSHLEAETEKKEELKVTIRFLLRESEA